MKDYCRLQEKPLLFDRRTAIMHGGLVAATVGISVTTANAGQGVYYEDEGTRITTNGEVTIKQLNPSSLLDDTQISRILNIIGGEARDTYKIKSSATFDEIFKHIGGEDPIAYSAMVNFSKTRSNKFRFTAETEHMALAIYGSINRLDVKQIAPLLSISIISEYSPQKSERLRDDSSQCD